MYRKELTIQNETGLRAEPASDLPHFATISAAISV